MKPSPSLSGHLSRRRFAAGVAGGVIAAVTAETTFPGAARAAGQDLRIRFGADISNLDPAHIFQIENQSVAANIYNGLVKYDQVTNKIVPDLATSWTVSPGGLVYTFNLHDGVTWHKGHGPFTADDVVFSLNRVKDPATNSPYAGQLAGIKTIEASQANVVRIVLHRADPGLLDKLTAFNQGWIISRKAFGEIGVQNYALHPIGTGPFVFESWTPGNEVHLSANTSYFAGPPGVSNVVFRVIRDETAAAVALQGGEIDIFFALQQPQVIEQLRHAPSVTVMTRPSNNTVNLVLNTTAKPLNDLRVRQAIILGIDRAALIDGFFKGTKQPAYSVLTSSFPQNTKDVPTYGFDPVRAKALLKAAGGDGFTLDLVTVALHPYDQLVIPVASNLNAIGIKTNIKVLERGAYLQARGKGDIMTCITAVVGPPDPDNPIMSLYARKSFPPGLNTAHYDGVEDLLDKLAGTQQEAARIEVYRQILARTMTDLPVVPLFADQLFVAHTSAVRGLVQNSLFTIEAHSVHVER